MNPRVIQVLSVNGAFINVLFANGEQGVFDAAPYLQYPAFAGLRNPGILQQATAERGTIAFPDGTDFCPDTVFLESTRQGV
jgi:hypothetical protein